MIYFSIILWVASVYFARKMISSIAFRIGFFIAALMIWCYLEFYLIADQFTDEGINEAVWYQIRMGFEGAGFKDFYWLIMLSVIGLFAAILWLATIFRKRNFKKSLLTPSILMMVVLIASPIHNDIIDSLQWYYYSDINKSKLNEYYHEPDDSKLENNKNLIYVYLEGFELTYLLDDRYKNEFPNLRKLRDSSMSFEEIGQAWGTGWTMGGMVASQCGVPLVVPDGANNSINKLTKFMPGALCLGDILKSNGYNNIYVGGAASEFAGKGNFYKQHGYEKVFGLESLRTLLKNPKLNAWGIYDDDLFKFVSNKLKELSVSNKPFALTMLTVDSHPPQGHISEKCINKIQSSENDMLTALRCTDYLMGEFLKDLDSLKLKNYLLIVGSDHLAGVSNETKYLKKQNRKNLFLVNGPRVESKKVYKFANTFDIAPTILGLLGWSDNRLGIGTNMLSNEETIKEKFGNAEKPFLISQSKELRKTVWSMGNLRDTNVVLYPKSNRVDIGVQQVQLPMALSYDDNYEIQDIFFSDYGARSIAEQVLRSGSENLIWVDSCYITAKVAGVSLKGGNPYCFLYGSLSSGGLAFGEITKDLNLSDLAKSLPVESGDNKKLKEDRNKIISEYIKYRSEKVIQLEMSNLYLNTSPFALVSRGTSTLGPAELHYKNGIDKLFTRGLTIVGVNADGPKKIAHLDTYDRGAPFKDSLDEIGDRTLKEVVSKYTSVYPLIIVLSSNSSQSGQFDFNKFVRASGVEKLNKIKHVEPYFAIFNNGKLLLEELGPANTSIAIEFVL